MFKLIAAAITALAQAFTERERNVKLRLIADTQTNLHNAKVELYQLYDAAVTGARVDLANLRVSDLEKFLATIAPGSPAAV